jgi:RNA polymerase sigma-70 factor (family 1)
LTKEEFKGMFDAYFDTIRSYLVYRGADKEQASDLAQDVFMRIWEKQMDVDPTTALRLLYKMAGNMFISRFRRTELERNYRTSLKDGEVDFSPEDAMHYNQLLDNYTKALAALPEKQRTVFLMARMEELTYNEIAERLNLSVKAIEKRMSIALSYLKKTLLT